jgi:peptide-methionine (R)-S-oxide reductase
MPRHRQIYWASVSTAAIVLLTSVSIAVAQDPFQQSEKSAAQDPFQAAEKSPSGSSEKSADKKIDKKNEPEPEFVRKTNAQWQRILPRAVYMVTRLKATEPAFSGKYAVGHFRGMFVCACCDAKLFSSQHKFDSGTGWPSFWQPVADRAIDRALDTSDNEPRIEVMCHRCGAHLGHVFDDGPPPTGLRFCINSLSLKLEHAPGEAARPASTKTNAKSKVKTTRSKSKSIMRSSGSRTTAKATEPDPDGPGDEKAAGSAPPAKSSTGGS